MSKPRLGVSACLIGHEVRFDGQHKRNAFVAASLGAHVEFVHVCPEVEVGMPVPRDTIRIERRSGAEALVNPKTGEDWSERMRDFARERVAALDAERLSGYVLKAKSPSCGLERVPVWNDKGMGEKVGVGFFAQALMERFPLLPVEEEGRLHDPFLREHFCVRVFAYGRLRDLFDDRAWTMGELVAFHSREKLLLMACSVEGYRELGRLVAGGKELGRERLEREYRQGFLAALGERSSKGRNLNVLQHAAGFFKSALDAEQKAALHSVLGDYREGIVPLSVPIALVRQLVLFAENADWLKDQTYLRPLPEDLRVRNWT